MDMKAEIAVKRARLAEIKRRNQERQESLRRGPDGSHVRPPPRPVRPHS